MRTVWLAGAIAVAVALPGCSSDDDTALVVQECKDAVTAHLAYPNDADFPYWDPSPDKDPDGTWHVSGTVTAKNALGGEHNVRWTCTVDSDDHVDVSVGV